MQSRVECGVVFAISINAPVFKTVVYVLCGRRLFTCFMFTPRRREITGVFQLHANDRSLSLSLSLPFSVYATYANSVKCNELV